MKRILTIDGGGIRGVIPAEILANIEVLIGNDIASAFDMIVGTSTGALIACGLTFDTGNGEPDYAAGTLSEMYRGFGEKIFNRDAKRKFKSAFGLCDEKYSSDGLRSVVTELFGDYKLSDALTKVMVTSYDTQSREAVLFKSWDSRYRDLHMVSAVLASTAAPTYFEPVVLGQGKKAMCLVDGGVYANNPVLCAIAEARNLWPDEEIKVLSLGTGYVQQPITYAQAKDFGVVGWARPLLDVVFDGQTHTANYIAEKLVNGFLRIDCDLLSYGCSEAMDDVSEANMRALRWAAINTYVMHDQEIDDFLKG